MDIFGSAVALLRGLHVGAMASLFGALLFSAAVLPSGADAGRMRGALLRLERLSALSGLLTGIIWLVMQAAAIAGTNSIATTLHAVPIVALQTQFGHWLLLRLVVLLAVLALLYRRGHALPLGLSGAALAIQPLLGHAGAIGGSAGAQLIASEALHMLAAGAWLGGLLPLFLAVGRLPPDAATAICRGFTPVGLASVLLLAGTAVVQAAAFVGGMPGLFGTGYGRITLLKLGLFVALLALAMLNRFVFTDRLTVGSGARPMRLAIAGEMLLGALVVIAAGSLASNTPGTHEQSVWPFPWRPSAEALSEPLLQTEAIAALITTAGGIALLVAAIVWRRIRWIAGGVAVVILGVAVPRLDLLFVAAYPTSFFVSPTEFAATSIVNGARLFRAHCVSCHGVNAQGDGPGASLSPVQPANLTAEHLLMHSDGDLYWFISHGFTAPNGTTAMPGVAGVLSGEAIWHLIDYLHAHYAGDAMRRTGQWPQPIPMPQFDVQCRNGSFVNRDDLHGRAVRIVALADGSQSEGLTPEADLMTVAVARSARRQAASVGCLAIEPQVWTALAILLGQAPGALAGTQILVDPQGWLRTVWRPGDTQDWNDPSVLAARVRDITDHPLPVDITTSFGHHH